MLIQSGKIFDRQKRFALKRALSVCLMFLFLLIHISQLVMAEEQERKVVRIGFPIQDGISYIDEKGDYAGYMVDYLNHVQLYTRWEIEYVQVEGNINAQLFTLRQMLESGEIDILGTMNYREELGDQFLYSNYPYGTTNIVLTADKNNTALLFNDFSNWDIIQIASYSRYQDQITLLQSFAESFGLQYEILEFETQKEALDAVKSGVADATIQVDTSLDDGTKIIAKVASTQYYFALNAEKTTLLHELNLAFEKTQSTFDFLDEKLHEKYFSSKSPFYVSDEDKEFIKSLGTVNVLFIGGNPPFQYMNGGKLKGSAVDYIEQFAEKTGLQYNTIVAESLSEANDLLQRGQIDLIACIPISFKLTTLTGLEFTEPYLNSRMIQVYSESNQGLLQTGSDEFRSNAGMALMEVQNNDSYAPWIDLYSLDYYRQNDDWVKGIALEWSDTKPVNYAAAITENMPDKLAVLLNNYADSIGENEHQELIYRYSGDTHHYTLLQLVYLYRYAILGTCIMISLVYAVFFFWKKSKKSHQLAVNRKKELNYLSSHDTLTGAYNENEFYKILEEDCKNKIPHTLAAFNVRGFKYINEKFSFETANELLNRICGHIQKSMRDGEYFCRQSADVFYMAISVDTIENIRIRSERAYKAIQQISNELLAGYPISIYGGFVFTDSSPEPFDVPANMAYVLAALAHAKRKDTDNTCFYSEEFHQQEQTRHYVEAHMESALEKCEFKLYLQAKKNLATGKIDKAEALVRWQPTNGRMIFPNEFIPVFEENGFCKKLDLYMFEAVCRQLRQWADEALPTVGISINQTKLLFAEPDYVDTLCRITQKYGILNNLITLELLEGLSMEDQIDQLNEQIVKLKQAGFRISMDDFGSGYSSLNVLGDLDIDELKVDRAFLMGNSRKANYKRRQILTEEIIRLSGRIGVSTVAEGVETIEDEKSILAFGYDYGQGYLYGKPIPADEFKEKYLKK